MLLRFCLEILVNFTLGIGLCMMLYAAELAFPRSEPIPLGQRRNAAVYTAIMLIAFAVAGAVLSVTLFDLGYQAPISLNGLGFPGTIIAVITGVIIGDFFYYWYHRASHHFPLLWRFHAVHHSIREMGAPTGYHHVAEPFLKIPFVIVPVFLLFSFPGAQFAPAIVALQGYYLHSTTRLNYGWFGWIITDNRAHRIHHSLDAAHQNRNFGVVTLLWDKLFGTAHFPQPEDWPAVGLNDRREPQNVWEFLLSPIR